ncbi:MAG: hypothetical protein CMH60_07635 [Myxococcales bacterium]|nr:hypothetical protein [Myxococcales bacterium]
MCEKLESEEWSESLIEDASPRRGFLKFLGLFTGIVAMLPASIAQAKKIALPLAKIKDLAKVGGQKLLKVKGKEILFVRDSETSVASLNPICTHKKCQVAFKPETGLLFCKCHKSAYDIKKGTVLDGPAPRPLEIYPTTLKNGKIIVDLPNT